jgi:5-(carboxyamino)imidazole ribonucleotide mutase
MPQPVVSIVMGSDSDLAVMGGAVEVLAEFGVPHEVRVISAHRAPDRTAAYAQSARGRGIRVIIAGAGMAAALPGVVAALTPLPVIGVPLRSTSSGLDGADALYSTVQMPPGVPVATVGIGGAKNAAHLAVRILALSDADLADRLDDARQAMADAVAARDARLQEIGIAAYLHQQAKE